MSGEKMQACPFCGWLETPSEKAEHIIVDGAHCLQCRRCKAVGPQTFDENGGVAAWNKREGGRQPDAPHTPEPSTLASATGSAYRMLKEGETIRESDEVLDDRGGWRKTVCAGGCVPRPDYTSHRKYRRLKDTPNVDIRRGA